MTEPVSGESNDSTRVNDQKESKDNHDNDVPDLGGEDDHSDSAVTTLLLLLGCLAAVVMVACTGGLLLLRRRRQVSWDWWRLVT